MNSHDLKPIQTPVTNLFQCRFPIIGAPMFLVSNPALVVAVSQAGGIGGIPSLNWKTSKRFKEAILQITSKMGTLPFAVNLIVNQSNVRLAADLAVCQELKVPLVITSLGNPKETIQKMHAVGCRVFCDVTTLDFAKKVEDLGADGVIAVSAGAGGHAGPISPLVLIPYLKNHLRIPIVAAGGIATGEQIAAALLLGASAVQIGTRFIASQESEVDPSYKKAILTSQPEDIVLTKKISGTPAAVIRTPYIDQQGLELNPIEKFLFSHPRTKKYMKLFRSYLGTQVLKKAASTPTWKTVWSAGQGVGLIHDILPASQIVETLVTEYYESLDRLMPNQSNEKLDSNEAYF